MQLYIKVLKFITVYWKTIALALVLTLFYVLFNNLSLWISVDFVRELFTAETVTQTVSDSTQSQPETMNKKDKLNQLFDTGKDFDLYTTINYHIKRILIQDTQSGTLKVLCLVIFLSFLLKNIIDYIRHVLLNYVEVRVTMNMRNRLHEKIMHLPIPLFDQKHTGEFTSISCILILVR
ncbi:MAG: ABC transporter transmembrane domain-containing protein [Calditrichaceae bacterium]